MTYSEWLEAIRKGDTYKIELGLRNSSWINQSIPGMATALNVACAIGQEKTFNALLDAGADINNYKPRSYSPLMLAASSGSLNIVNTLIERGAELNHQNGLGETALFLAIKDGYDQNPMEVKVVRRLVEAGANIFIKDDNGTSPLMQASFFLKEDLIHYLVNQGALINEQDSAGNSPIMMVSDYDNEISKRLVLYFLDQGVDLSACNEQDETAEELVLNAFRNNEWIREKIKATKEKFLLNQTLQEPHVNGLNGRLAADIKRL